MQKILERKKERKKERKNVWNPSFHQIKYYKRILNIFLYRSENLGWFFIPWIFSTFLRSFFFHENFFLSVIFRPLNLIAGINEGLISKLWDPGSDLIWDSTYKITQFDFKTCNYYL